ncbi:MAG: hypothetical protein L7U57_01675 [Glaciecola sp.]|nr:hypothetical protein [Glaciecola sp.]
MQYNTAICFLLSALATISLILQKKTLSISLAIILIVLAGLTGFQYIIGQNLGIDQLFMDACFGVNIDMIQGYFYSRPTTAEVFEQQWLTH